MAKRAIRKKKTMVVTTGDAAKGETGGDGAKPGAGKGKKYCPFCSKIIGASKTTCPECGKTIPPKAGKKSKRRKKRGGDGPVPVKPGVSFPFGANANGVGAAVDFIRAAGGIDAARRQLDELAALKGLL